MAYLGSVWVDQMPKFIIVLDKLDTSVPEYICMSLKPMIWHVVCVAALGPALHGQSVIGRRTSCNLLHFINHANSYNPSQNFLWRIWKCRHIFWVVKKLQLLEEAIPLNIHWVHCLRSPGTPTCNPMYLHWPKLKNSQWGFYQNFELHFKFIFFPFNFSMPKRIGFWKINHKSKTYWLLWFIEEKKM